MHKKKPLKRNKFQEVNVDLWILDCIRMPLATQNQFQSERLKVTDTKP